MSPTVSMKPRGSFYDLPGVNVSRYVWVADRVRSRRVLDYGCGHGYGARFLSDGIAKFVLGVDVETKAIKFAVQHYRGENLEFRTVDEWRMEVPASTFDAVVSFEVLEHLEDPGPFLSTISRVLRPGGDLFLSTPNKLWTEQFYTRGKPSNVFHLKEYYPVELKRTLEKYFDPVTCFVRYTTGDYDQRRLEWSKYMATCPIPMSLQRKSPRLIQAGIRSMYSRLLHLLGRPPPSELRGRYDLNRIEPAKAEAISARYPEQLWWATKRS